jgi:hypothetical protein
LELKENLDFRRSSSMQVKEPLHETAARRYIPLISWIIVIATLFLITQKIIGYGYLPAGDARRHVAKAFTDKPYTDVVVMRSAYVMDHSPGWEWLLGFCQRVTHLSEDQVMSLALVITMLCIFLAPLPWLKRPEAWLAALLVQMVAIPELMVRFTQARPLLFTEGVLIAILFAWSQKEEKRPSWLKLGLTTLGLALSVWVHGTWYLWVLLVAAFFLANWWRQGFWLAVCWMTGTLAGALLTGKPVAFLKQAIEIVLSVSNERLSQSMLVGELAPSYGEFTSLAMLGIVYLICRQLNRNGSGLFCPPVFCLIVICWALGFKADRFWADWGLPAGLVWMTLMFQQLSISWTSSGAVYRIATCGLVALPLFLHSTNDLDRRYTTCLDEVFLDANDPDLKGWFPEPQGIFYSANLGFFYNTFYKNPRGDWRYILGFEPALIPDEDRRIYRYILQHRRSLESYSPWIEKLRPIDRIVVYSSSQPELPKLEWHQAAGGMWIGRLLKEAKAGNR